MRLGIVLILVLGSCLGWSQSRRNPLKGLSNLNPYDDVAVLQRKFLPKTERWEFYAATSFLMNDPFFLNLGLMGRLAYSWKEQHAIEAIFQDVSPSKRKIVDDLEGLSGSAAAQTSTLISPEAFFGLTYRWSPIYGKMTPFSEGILPFDMYFSAGGGITMTNRQGSEPTFTVGSGQIFAIDKSTAFRWDFSWVFFNGTAALKDANGQLTGQVTSQTFSQLYLNFGVSFFFPEAGYR